LEEGYLRPHRVTYERWGNNGRSPLLGIALDRMAASVGAVTPPSGGAQDGGGLRGRIYGTRHCIMPGCCFPHAGMVPTAAGGT
jgi:hypothetical protein